jgi:5-methyltetrahydrofolate--homocysteine methyltransferase
MNLIEGLAQAVLVGDEVAAPQAVTEALAANLPPIDILRDGLLAGMSKVGQLFQQGEYFVPEVLVAAEAMKAAMGVLQPALLKAGVRPERTAVIGTVHGDLHDIGKNLVAIMLQGAGFEVVDLGVDVTAEQFLAACQQQRVDIVGLSALLTTTAPEMGTIIRCLRAALSPTPLILVGGAAVNQDYAKRIGADGYGADAASGAELARELCASGARS